MSIVDLPTFSESSARDFHLLMTGISKNVLATSEDFRRFFKDFQTLPKMSEDVPTISEHFQSYLKLFSLLSNVLKHDILACSDTVRTQTRH